MTDPIKGETAVPEAVIIACSSCQVKNRVLRSRLPEQPKCGKCGSLLNSGLKPPTGRSEPRSAEKPRFGQDRESPVCSGERSYKVDDVIGGRYQVQEICGGEGKSAMGIVYVCYDCEHQRSLALKTLQNRYLDSKKTMDNFKKEALAWIYLEKHPYIVRAYWAREIDHHMFIGCEYISPDGLGRNTITPYLKSPFSLKQTLKWAIQFCYGMEYACSKGVTPHRDIKPDNIMITMDGDVKITDFGLVGLWNKAEQTEEIRDLIQKNQKGLTFLSTYNNRIVAGSPPWMAPEQFYGVSEVKSDIYSFGIILFQMVNNGKLPFEPRKGDTWRHAHKDYPIPKIPGKGEVLADVITTCLQKRRDKRYEDFRSLRMDLEKIFHREITKRTGEKPPPPPHIEDLKDGELINKGMSLTNLGLVEEGIRNYRESIRLNPKNADAHYNLGNALAQKGLFKEAIISYREALRIDSDLNAAHFNLGIALFNSGHIDAAITEYKEALRSNPDFDAAYVNLGVALYKKGLTDQAIAAYKEAVRINPYFSEAYYKLGITYLAKNDLDDAIQSFRDAVRIAPQYADAHNNLGTAYMRKGQTDEAVIAYGKAVVKKAGFADAYHNLGSAFIRKNMYREALGAYEEFVRYSRPQDNRRDKAKEMIGKLRDHLQKGQG
ncbi:MAG: tetratricopeptide repeat protein [Nitrospirae bacterium]|nr:tetratricopeptide repeat protein [Nitrospirota bacterium]